MSWTRVEKKYTRLLGQCGVITHRPHGPPHTYTTPEPPHSRDHHASYTSRSLLSYTSSSLFSTPLLPDSHAPPLRPRDTSAVTISHGKGSGNLPNASGSGTSGPTTKQKQWSCVSFGVVLFRFFSIFVSFLDICNTWVLALENWEDTSTEELNLVPNPQSSMSSYVLRNRNPDFFSFPGSPV